MSNATIRFAQSGVKNNRYVCNEQAKHASNTQYTADAEPFDIFLVAGVDRVRIPAHRSLLSASSNYFLAMFRGSMKESSAVEIELLEIDADVIQLIVDFIYSASIDLNADNVEHILNAADYLQVNTLITICCDFIGDQIDISNCLGVVLFAEQRNNSQLYKKALGFACKHFKKLRSEEEFLLLREDQLTNLLSRDDIQVGSEEFVFHCLVSWINFDAMNREKFMVNLLSTLRFPFLKPKFILEHRLMVCRSIECYELICSWLQWHLSPEHRSAFPRDCTKPRKSNNKLAYISEGSTDNLRLQIFDREENTWSYKELPKPPTTREEEFKMINIESQLIIAGGQVGGIVTNKVESLDLHTLEWSELSPMPVAKIRHAMAELHGDLYVVGGSNGKHWLCSVEKYDFSTRKWSELQPLRRPFILVRVAVLNGLIYACDNVSHTLECYDPQTNTWTTKNYKEEKSSFFGIAGVGKHLYSVGGFSDRSAVQTVARYDPETDQWSKVTPMQLRREKVSCVALNNRLIACGGSYGPRELNDVEEYDPVTDEWKFLAPLLPYQTHPPYYNLFLMYD